MSDRRVDLAIVIVSYNARPDLERCLDSLHRSPPAISHEIVVVDNASSDGSAQAVRARWPTVRVIENRENIGFGAANNRGIRASDSSLILVLNGDTLVPPGAIDRLANELTSSPDVGAVGPRLVDEQGRSEISFGRMIGPFAELARKMLGRAYEMRLPGAEAYVRRLTSRPRDVDWVSGACLLVRRTDASAAGLFDERFALYCEDVDFCCVNPAVRKTRAIRAHERDRAPEGPIARRRTRHLRPRLSTQPGGFLREAPPRMGGHTPNVSGRPRKAAARRMTTSSSPDMRIGIDARKLHDFGIGTYIRNLLRHLGRLDRESEYVLFCRPADVSLAAGVWRELSGGRRTGPALFLQRAARHPARRRAGAAGSVSRAALRAAAAHGDQVARHHSRLHPPDVPAVSAEPPGVRLRARVDVGRRPSRVARADRVGVVEARHPALLRHRAREDHGHLQRHRRTVQSAARRGRCGQGSDALSARPALHSVRGQRQAAQEPRADDQRVPSGAQGRVRRSAAGDHRRRNLQAPGASAGCPPLHAPQARSLPGLRARRHPGRAVPARRGRSSSRLCTRASGCRPSRPWRAAPRS